MAYAFYFGSTIGIWVIFYLCTKKKPLRLKDIVTGIASVAFSMTFETLFGVYGGLYYYIEPEHALLYLTASSVVLYPLLNMLYVLFLPQKSKPAILYTIFWIAAMLAFEWVSIVTRTIILTGWRIFPYSYLTYIATYAWLFAFYRYLDKRIREESVGYR